MGFAITTTCREPERFIQFVDYLCSDEGQILLNWGIEGKQYQVENGVRTVIGSVWQKFYMDPTYRQQVGLDAIRRFGPPTAVHLRTNLEICILPIPRSSL